MTIKDLIMPIDYFNLNEASAAVNSAVYSLAGLILIISIAYEYINERDIFGPMKRFFVALIFLTLALPVQHFVVERSFEVSDILMNSLSDPDKLEMITDPSAFMDKLSEVQFANNTKQVTDEGDAWEVGNGATVTYNKINFAGVIFDQFKNIPNILIATVTFGFISYCLFTLQASYYILYFISGALFVIPAILSIFPAFESSLSGAFKSLGTLFVTPIFVSLIAAMLSIKMAEFGGGKVSAGDSIHNVAIIAALCFALASSIYIASQFLSSSGISQNLGAAGSIATAAVLSGAVQVGASAIRNRTALLSGARGFGNGLLNTARSPLNTARNAASLMGSGLAGQLNKASGGSGKMAKITKPIQSMMNKSGELKSQISSKADNLKKSLNHHGSFSSPVGRAAGLLRALPKSSGEFKKANSEMTATKNSGVSKVSPAGTVMPRHLVDLMKANSNSPSYKQNTPINALTKSHLLYNNKGGFKFGARSIASSGQSARFSGASTPSNWSKQKFGSPVKNNQKAYKLNNWEQKFMDKTAGKSSLSHQERLIKSNIENVQKYGRKNWENKFVENISTMKNPTSKQIKTRDSILSKRR